MNTFVGLVGISGVGKSTIAAALDKYHWFDWLPSYTTRAPRETDLPGEYMYVKEASFWDRERCGDFLEIARHGEHLYALAKPRTRGPFVSPINGEGIKYLTDHFPEHGMRIMPVGIIPPDMSTLMARNQATPGFAARAGRDHFHGTVRPPELPGNLRYEMTLVNHTVEGCARIIAQLVDFHRAEERVS